MFDRVKEHRERPEAINALKEVLNASMFFLRQVQNTTEDEQYFTEVELNSLDTLINNTWASLKCLKLQSSYCNYVIHTLHVTSLFYTAAMASGKRKRSSSHSVV